MTKINVLCLGLLLAGCDSGAAGNDGGADLSASVPDLLASADLASPPDLVGTDLTGVPPSVTAAIHAVPECAVMAVVDLDVTAADEVEVAFGPTTAYGTKTPRIAVPAGGGKVSVPIFGLTPSSVTHARATAFRAGASGDSSDVMVTLAAAPADLPPLHITTNDNQPTDALLVTAFKDFNATSYALAYERKTGRILWYRDITPASTRAFDAERQTDGHITVYQNKTNSFEELLPTGEVVNHWSLPKVAWGADGHDIQFLANHNALMIGIAMHAEDTRPLSDAGVADGMVLHDTIDEVTPDGGTVFHWETYPEVQLSELNDFSILLDGALDTVHINAIEPTPDGNILVSMRQADCIAKLDKANKKIMWRLGGVKSDFKFVGDPLNGFLHQHDVRLLPNGHLSVYDNGNSRPPSDSYTRVLEYQLDETAKTATLVWSYSHNPPILSKLAGSARRLANGNTVVSYAQQGLMVEVDASKTVKWEADIAPYQLYRALPIPSLYP